MAVEITRNANGNSYAVVRTSVRQGNKVVKSPAIYLGLVLDRERGIYQSRERGIFHYDEKTNTFGPAPDDFTPPNKKKNKQEKLILDYGDAFLFDKLIKKYNIDKSINSLNYKNNDSIYVLLLYYIIKNDSISHLSDWYNGSFAKILYPDAKTTSKRIEELLEFLGNENNLQKFFSEYIKHLGNDVGEGENILFYYTVFQNIIQLPYAAAINNKDEISEEFRLVYVINQRTRLPIYIRYIPENAIDVSALLTTVKELNAVGVNSDLVILDAEYVSEDGFDCLCEEKISFIAKCPESRPMYKQAVDSVLKDLEVAENIAINSDGKFFNGRHVYIKMVKLDYKTRSGNDINIYAYVCRDKSIQEKFRKQAIVQSSYSKNIDKEKFHSNYQKSGIFVFLSTTQIKSEDVLNYHICHDKERIIGIKNNFQTLIQPEIENKTILAGHFLMVFMSTYILQKLQNEIKSYNYSIKDILYKMQTQKIEIYDNVVIPQEPCHEHNEIYRFLDVKHCAKHKTPSVF